MLKLACAAVLFVPLIFVGLKHKRSDCSPGYAETISPTGSITCTWENSHEK